MIRVTARIKVASSLSSSSTPNVSARLYRRDHVVTAQDLIGRAPAQQPLLDSYELVAEHVREHQPIPEREQLAFDERDLLVEVVTDREALPEAEHLFAKLVTHELILTDLPVALVNRRRDGA
jgi:hypothetical protein